VQEGGLGHSIGLFAMAVKSQTSSFFHHFKSKNELACVPHV